MLKTTAVGHIGQDARVNVMTNGQVAINFSIAHSEKWKDSKGEKQEKTIWINCVIYRDQDKSNIAQYLTKGQLVGVSGKVSARAYMTAQNTMAASLELNVTELELLGGKADKQPDAQPNTAPVPAPAQVTAQPAATTSSVEEAQNWPNNFQQTNDLMF